MGGRLGRGGQGLQLGLDGDVAGGELCLTHIKEVEILRQDEHVLVAVVAGERRGDLGRGGSAVRVAVLGEHVRVVHEPGSRWHYSGGGYTVAQLIVEEVTGKS